MKGTENSAAHWSQQKEQAAGYWHVKFLLILFKIFPVIILRIIAFPVGFFYCIFSQKARTESKRFLQKAAPCIANPETEKKCRSPLGPLRHFIAFSLTLIEKIQTWGGTFPFKNIHFQDDDIGGLIEKLENKEGVVLITSHLGNIELLRGLASFSRTGVSRNVPVTAIVDIKVTAHFNRMLHELNPQSSFDLMSAQDIGPHTTALLEEKIAAGEMVTIAGDRTPVNGTSPNLKIPFLGEEAPFSTGAFYLAALLQAPVYFVTALRRGDLSVKPEYDMYVHKNSISLDCTRKERLARSAELARSYAAVLESYCKKQPFQWYNFFNFWSQGA